MKVEFQQDGSSQGRSASVNNVVLRVIESRGLKCNGQVIRGRDFGANVLDKPPVIRNEDLDASLLGWSYSQNDDLVTITQELPYFFHLAALVREVTIN